MKSQIPMTYLPTKQGGGGEPTPSSEVLINYQAYARSLEPAGPLWTTAHFPPPLLSQNIRTRTYEISFCNRCRRGEGGGVTALRVSI